MLTPAGKQRKNLSRYISHFSLCLHLDAKRA